MISWLMGEVVRVEPDSLVLATSGVGYQVAVTSKLVGAARTGSSLELHVHTHVREDALALYGFSSLEELRVYKELIAVTGLGPKIAMAVLGAMSPDELREAVASQDLDRLCEVPGVGKRMAQRISLELAGKLGPVADASFGEVREALVGLGYTPAEVREALERIGDDEAPVEVKVKRALKELAAL